jgi:drug/metabolite transporter (DMT)-like permease
MAQISDNARGAGFMVLSMAGFSSNDALIKLVSDELDLFQAIFLRGVMVSALMGGMAWAAGAFRHLPGRRDRRILAIRSVGEIGGTFCFLTALFNMPIANASAILQSLPLAITLAAAVVFGEPVGWRRMAAILIGFAGVLIIVRPGAVGFNAYALFAVAAVGFIVLRDLSTRRLSPEMPSLQAAVVTAAAITAAAGLVSIFSGWRPVGAGSLAALAGSASCLIVGYIFGVMTMRVGEIAFVSPFRYTLLLWAMLLGYLVFSEVPDAWMLTGAAVVVATGLYTFHRERNAGVAKARRADATAPAIRASVLRREPRQRERE